MSTAVSTRVKLLPFVVKATTAWCSAYGVDTHFWSEKDIGSRVCTWLDRTLIVNPTSVGVVPEVVEDLLKCLDILIRSGVARAREIEEQITVRLVSRHPAGFAPDSPLEGEGFEPSVPRQIFWLPRRSPHNSPSAI